MLVILVRHGNTFEPDQTPYYVGAKTDIPLSSSGSQQAAAFANAMDKAGILPIRVLTSQLKRTQQHVLPMLARLEITQNAVADARLNEMDYGTWERKTAAEVDAMNGVDLPRLRWDKDGIYPEGAGFKPSEDEIKKNVESLVAEITSQFDEDKIVVICSSNGIIRHFLKLVPGAYEKAKATGGLKVGTGSISALDLQQDPSQNKLLFWNKKPSEAPLEDY